MSAWWNDLSRREQLLIGVAGGLLTVFLFTLLVVRPILQWRADAVLQAEQARDGYEMVATAAALGGEGAAVTAPRAATPLRQAITTSAVAAQIELVRIGAETDGQIEVQPAPVDGDRLFQWLADLEKTYAVKAAFADMTRVEGGLVNAQILVFERR